MSDILISDILSADLKSLKVEPKGYDSQDDMLKIKSMQKKFRDSFVGAAVDATKWDATNGSGMTTTVSGGILTIASGTTANADTYLISKEIFTVPFRITFNMGLSQRIANQSFYIEAISVNKTTGVPDGLNAIGWLFDGTTATQGKYVVQNGGAARFESALSTITTTAGAVSIYEIEPFADEAWFHGGTLDSSSGRSNSYRRHQQIPDPNAVYKIRIRVLNGGTAPATTTSMTMQFVACQDYAELTAEITAGRGQAVAGQAMGVILAQTATVTGSGTFIMGGVAAHDAAISGSPVRVAGRAITANYTGVATGDVADLTTTVVGSLITKPYSIPEADWTYGSITPITTAVTTAVKVAGAAGIRNYVTGLQFINTSATVGVVSIQDGTTVIWAGYAPQNVPITASFKTPLKGTAATAMNFVTAMAGSIYVNVQGYQAP